MAPGSWVLLWLRSYGSAARRNHRPSQQPVYDLRNLDATRQLKQSLMRHLFTYGPVPVDQVDGVKLKETEIGAVPEGWEVARLGEHAQLATGGTPSRKRPEYWRGDIPWVKTADYWAVRFDLTRQIKETFDATGIEIPFPQRVVHMTASDAPEQA